VVRNNNGWLTVDTHKTTMASAALTKDEEQRLAEDDSCGDLVAWHATCCCGRGDGTPFGTRALDLSARVLFWLAGMTTGSRSNFRRRVWDALTVTQLSGSRRNYRGVDSSDLTCPGIEGDPPVPLRRYDLAASASPQRTPHSHQPASFSSGDERGGGGGGAFSSGASGGREAVLVVFHGGGFCIQSHTDIV
jgi:hypothetical protein